MRKPRARESSKKAVGEYGLYEIKVSWQNDDREKGVDILEEATIVATKPYVRDYIERLAKHLCLGGGKWKWYKQRPVYSQKGGCEGKHYITYEKVC